MSAAERAAATAAETKQRRDEYVRTKIAAMIGATPLEQELLDTLRLMLALPADTDLSATREIARAALVGATSRKLTERLFAATLLTVALDVDTDTSPARGRVAREFIRNRLFLAAEGSVKVIRQNTESLERAHIPDSRSADRVFARSPFWWAIKLAAVRRYALPKARISVFESDWRAYWQAMQRDGATAPIAPADRIFPPPPAIPFAGSGTVLP